MYMHHPLVEYVLKRLCKSNKLVKEKVYKPSVLVDFLSFVQELSLSSSDVPYVDVVDGQDDVPKIHLSTTYDLYF